MKSFKQHLTEAKDPPMLLTLRRQGIRNFPNGERVALFSNPQLKIQIAVSYDATSGALKPSNMLPLKEDQDEGTESREEMVSCLTDAYKALIVPNPTELQAALHNWLKSEIEENGDFGDMPDDVLCDVHDDYCALTKGTDLGEAVEGVGMHHLYGDWKHLALARGAKSFVDQEKRRLAIHPSGKIVGVWNHEYRHGTIPEEVTLLEKNTRTHTINNYADWHDAAEKKGGQETTFKVHNAGGSTSAYKSGTHLGTFHHDKKTGHIFEEVLEEAPIHRINTILKTGEEQNVIFKNGAAGRVHPHTAKTVHDLFHKVNKSNKSKLSELINSSPEGLEKVHKFAQSMAATAKKEAK